MVFVFLLSVVKPWFSPVKLPVLIIWVSPFLVLGVSVECFVASELGLHCLRNIKQKTKKTKQNGYILNIPKRVRRLTLSEQYVTYPTMTRKKK